MVEVANPLEEWVLRSWEEDAAELPAFPTMAIRLVDAIESPDVEVATVEEIISQDGSITAQVIRTANSAFYGAVAEAQDLHQAIMRVGFRETANVAMMAASRSLYALDDRAELECFPGLWADIWESSLVCAYGTRLLSRELKLGDPTRAFMCGMLRDVGCLLITKLVAGGLVRGRLREKPEDDELSGLFASLHPRLGAEYLQQNHMPEYVIEVAERHHLVDVPFAHDTIAIHLVRCADGICDKLEVGPFCAGEVGPAALESAAALGIGDDRLEYFELQFEGIREQVGDLMAGP